MKSKFISGLVVAALLMGMSSVALANADIAVNLQQDVKSIVDGDFDRYSGSTAMVFLSDLYGEWVIDGGSEQTLLMILISGASAFAAFVGIALISYMMVSGAATSALAGQAMIGDRKVAVWYVGRIALAFTLIMPIAGGISPFHALMGNTVIPISSAVADATANQVREYMLSGGSFSPMNSTVGLMPQENLNRSLICAMKDIPYEQGEDEYELYRVTYHDSDSGRSQGGNNSNADVTSTKGGTIPQLEINESLAVDSIKFGEGCGEWKIGSLGDYKSDADFEGEGYYDDKRRYAERQINKAAFEGGIKVIINHINNTAVLLREYMSEDSNFPSLTDLYSGELSESEEEYVVEWFNIFGETTELFPAELAEAIRSSATSGSADQALRDLISEDDWMQLGFHYHDLKIAENISATVFNSLIRGVDGDASDAACEDVWLVLSWFNDDKVCKVQELSYSQAANLLTASMILNANKEDASYMGSNIGHHVGNFKCTRNTCDPKAKPAFDNGTLLSLMGGESSDEGVWGSGSVAGGAMSRSTETFGEGSRGMATVEGISENMGNNLLQLRGALMAVKYASIITHDSILTFSDRSFLLFKTLVSDIDSAISVIMAQSFFLKYVIPMMPIFMWAAALLAYLILTIEVMIAAPFAILLMLMPEGEGILGTRLERFIGLITAVTLRPLLIVIGAGAYLTINSPVTEKILKPAWAVFGNYGYDFFGVFAKIMIFIFLMYQLQLLMLSLIISMPGHVTELITSFRRDYGEQRAAESIGSGGERVGEKTGESINNTFSHMDRARERKAYGASIQGRNGNEEDR